MKKGAILFISLLLMVNCGRQQNVPSEERSNIKCVEQNSNGNMLLKISDAESYSDMSNSIYNAAEWNAKFNKSGRYEVWMISSSNDSLSMHYVNPVRVNTKNIELKIYPKCDKISTDSSSPSSFMISSYLGTVYIQDTGIMDVQIICEQIVPDSYSGNVNSKFVSLSFIPETK